MSDLSELLDRRNFSETVDAIVYAPPRATSLLFPLLALTFLVALGWLAFVPFEETIHARGDLRVAGDAVPLHAQQEGKVIAVAAREGAFVEKGTVLFRFDDALPRMELERVDAEIARLNQRVGLTEGQRERARARAAAEVGRIDRDVARNREMFERGILPKQVVENLESERRARAEASRQEQLAIESDAVAARQELDRLQGERARLLRGLADETVRAAESGVITQLGVRAPGEVVSRGSLLATITPHGRPMEMEAVVAPRDIARLRAGMPARVELDPYPSRQFGEVGGRVTFVAPERDERGYRVRIALSPSTLQLRTGMTGTVDVISDRRPLYRALGERLGIIR